MEEVTVGSRMRNSVTCMVHQILLGRSNQGE